MKESNIYIRLISLLVFLPFGAIAQDNLITNGSFEEHSNLPQNLGEWNKCTGWSNAGSQVSDPDYFHNDGGMAADLPETPVAILNAFSGKAMMGFVAAKTNSGNYREYVTNQLTEPLEPGKKYKLSFRISNGNITSSSNSGLGVSGLAVALTKELPSQNQNELLNESPHFEIDTVIFDRGWMKAEFVFQVEEEFEFLTLGVFKPDSEVQIIDEDNSSGSIAYYFIDDFRLKVYTPVIGFEEEFSDDREDPTDPGDSESDPEPENHYYADDTEFYIPNAFTPDGDGINDFFKPYSPNRSNYTFSVFDRWGAEMFSTDNIALGWDGRNKNGTRAECDVYIWRVSYLDKAEDGKEVTRSLSGRINLIR